MTIITAIEATVYVVKIILGLPDRLMAIIEYPQEFPMRTVRKIDAGRRVNFVFSFGLRGQIQVI